MDKETQEPINSNENKPKKGGRPKGSKDKKPRKKRGQKNASNEPTQKVGTNESGRLIDTLGPTVDIQDNAKLKIFSNTLKPPPPTHKSQIPEQPPAVDKTVPPDTNFDDVEIPPEQPSEPGWWERFKNRCKWELPKPKKKGPDDSIWDKFGAELDWEKLVLDWDVHQDKIEAAHIWIIRLASVGFVPADYALPPKVRLRVARIYAGMCYNINRWIWGDTESFIGALIQCISETGTLVQKELKAIKEYERQSKEKEK